MTQETQGAAPVDITVTWSDEDKVYIARSERYSYLATHGDTPEDAREELLGLLGQLEPRESKTK